MCIHDDWTCATAQGLSRIQTNISIPSQYYWKQKRISMKRLSANDSKTQKHSN